MSESDSGDTLEHKAYRLGKVAGYSIGIVDGWDECAKQLHVALGVALREPASVVKHREAVLAAQRGRES